MAVRESVSLRLRNVAVDRGGKRVLSGIDLTVNHQARMAVIGANGVGKSTLLAIMSGALVPTVGRVTASPPSTAIGLLDQEVDRSPLETGRDLISRRTGVTAAQADFDAATIALAAGEHGSDEWYNRALAHWQRLGGFDLDPRVDRLADEVGLPADALNRPTAALSGGELTRVGLIATMAHQFDIVLLDEPTNNLDGDGLSILEHWMTNFDGPIVYVSHDRRFLEVTASSVAHLDDHRDGVEVFNGGWTEFEAQLATTRRQAEESYRTYTAERTRIEQAAQRKREWADRGAGRVAKRPADNDRNRRRYEQASADKQAGFAKKIADRLSRLEEVEKPWKPWELRLSIAEAERSSSEVVVLKRVEAERGGFTLGPLSETIGAGERILVDGPNGAGKTTLLSIIVGDLEPTSGAVSRGPSVLFGVIRQGRTEFVDAGEPHGNEADSILARFVARTGLNETDSRSLLAKFGIDAPTLNRDIRTISPGERTRLELAVFQASGVNAIVLDEPTNHLDMPAIEQLEQALSAFSGTLIVVSHDQRFREALAFTRTISLDHPA